MKERSHGGGGWAAGWVSSGLRACRQGSGPHLPTWAWVGQLLGPREPAHLPEPSGRRRVVPLLSFPSPVQPRGKEATRPFTCWALMVLCLSWCLILFYFILINLFIYFWLRWVFVAARRLSLVAASRGYSSLRCAGFSLRWLLLLQSTGSRHTGSVVVAHGL